MQLHGPAQIIEESGVSARLNPGTDKPFAVMEIGGVALYIYTPEEADWLIAAACEAKRLLLGESLPCDPVAPRCESRHVHLDGALLHCSLEQDHPGLHRCTPAAAFIAEWIDGDDTPPAAGPCPSVAPHTGRECTLDAGHDGQHRSGNVVWDDEPQAPEPGGCMCRHPGYEHIYAGQQPCTQCACTAFAAMPVPAETAGSAK